MRPDDPVSRRARAHLTPGYAPWSPKTEEEAELRRALAGLDGPEARLEAEAALAALDEEGDR